MVNTVILGDCLYKKSSVLSTLQNYCFSGTYASTQNSHFLVAHITVIRYTQVPKKNTPHTMRDN